jgi:hypothetical protein
MGDLAQAMVALARAAERRRGARAQLLEATDTIAAAIREQLRSGDKVLVEKYPPLKVAELKPGEPEPDNTVEYEAVRVRYTKPEGGSLIAEDALARDFAIFGLKESQPTLLKVIGWKDDWKPHIANMNERQSFVHEAEGVIRSFSRDLTVQAAAYEETAKKATKLVPR